MRHGLVAVMTLVMAAALSAPTSAALLAPAAGTIPGVVVSPDDQLQTAQRTVTRWMNRLVSSEHRRLRRMSTSHARLYADYLVRTDPYYDSARQRWRVIEPASDVQALGGGRYRTDMVVRWILEGEAIELRRFVYEDRDGQSPKLVQFVRDGRPLRAYIKKHGTSDRVAGVRAKLVRVFRRADMDRTAVAAIVRVKNNRRYRIGVDDEYAPLTIRNGVTRYAREGRFPRIRPGRSRDIILDYRNVPDTQRGGWLTFMVYGPSGDAYEFEASVTMKLRRWTRS